MKYTFRNDYSEGCHPNILKALTQTNMVQSEPYGNDAYSIGARELIRAKMGTQDTAIFFVSGGTLVNLILHSVALRSHEAVIAPQSGHILTNEAGAVEATGHKIVSADVVDGKLTAQNLQKAIDAHQHYPHITLPRLVYISNATEVGTVYSKADIVALSAICRANNLYFMVDGARMGAAISSDASDLTLADLAEYVDIFWIGGTKAGALFGEAIVIPNKDLAKDFEVHLKQRGALLAKGRALGIQFQELFTDNLFFKLAKRGNDLALKIADNILAAGFEMAAPCEANMLMPILPNTLIDRLEEQFDFYRWKKIDDDHTQLRLVTSWATDEAQVDRFIGMLK